MKDQHSREELQRRINERQRGSNCELEQNSLRILVNFWQENIEDSYKLKNYVKHYII